uniref:Uncharacterized protein n=1 Tax=Eutreptiella gymnastica TaxID=73025 RepID=A0A7S4FVT2_9EUGL
MTHQNLLQSVRHGMTTLTLTLKYQYQYSISNLLRKFRKWKVAVPSPPPVFFSWCGGSSRLSSHEQFAVVVRGDSGTQCAELIHFQPHVQGYKYGHAWSPQ